MESDMVFGDKNGTPLKAGDRVMNDLHILFTIVEDPHWGLTLIGKKGKLREKLTPILASQLVIAY